MRLYQSKFEEVALLLAPATKTLLDVGCRDGKLREHLPAAVKYTGIDLTPGPGVAQICDIEQGIPFPDNCFDAVVALDVLEHTDNIWFAFREMVRVARSQIMVVFPNSYHWWERLRFLRGKERDKHKLEPQVVKDRHRWLTSYTTAHAFANHMAEELELILTEAIMVDERPNWGRELLARVLPNNLMSVAIFFLFVKSKQGVFADRVL
jgi:2-polyprenyl-3-methyl-5-hydroxy-6-metoxy-1,4-benzoquinol methylase